MSPLPWARLDLPEIARALDAIGAALTDRPRPAFNGEEPLTPDVLRRLLEGFRYVDLLLDGRIDLFAYGGSKHVLELNHRVLCGVSPERREQFADHLAETERRFYDDREGGIGELHDWVSRNRNRPTRGLTAGVFVHAVSTPQLFIEGNRRTALLLASYLLARGGLPPLVVTAADYPRFDAISDRALAIDRRRFASSIGLTQVAGRFAEFLQDIADPRFLRETAVPANAGERPV